jgi:hypothetical protein
MSYSEHAKATVKIVVTGPDGKVLRVIEGEGPDPFGLGFLDIIHSNVRGLLSSITMTDVFNRPHTFNIFTPSPSSSLGYLVPGFCLINCPNAGLTPPDSPGIWLYSDVPFTGVVNGWIIYLGSGIFPPSLITGLSYSPPVVNLGASTPSSPGDIVYQLYSVSQSITNTLSSPVNVHTVMLVGAFYGTLSASPVYMPVTFYVFDSPIVFSPGATMTVTVTLSFPIGIAARPAPTATTAVQPTTTTTASPISFRLGV